MLEPEAILAGSSSLDKLLGALDGQDMVQLLPECVASDMLDLHCKGTITTGAQQPDLRNAIGRHAHMQVPLGLRPSLRIEDLIFEGRAIRRQRNTRRSPIRHMVLQNLAHLVRDSRLKRSHCGGQAILVLLDVASQPLRLCTNCLDLVKAISDGFRRPCEESCLQVEVDVPVQVHFINIVMLHHAVGVHVLGGLDHEVGDALILGRCSLALLARIFLEGPLDALAQRRDGLIRRNQIRFEDL
mmetsp:Transcript_98088/g.245812  ORF Transcript_98088/g.245812 Transcript_98088/m.245812 type:complete len:242 (-) Transcript_98088:1392-2117(-)